jgi:Fic family protein
MDVTALSRSPVGRLVPISGTDGRTGRPYEYLAYLADPLPDSLDLSPATWTCVTGAEAALSRLDEASGHIPVPSLLWNPLLRREAVSTSALEGTYAPLDDVLASDAGKREGLPSDLRDVLNYVASADHCFRWVTERPITATMISDAQRILVAGTPGELSDAGGLRDRQVFIGPADGAIDEARFVPAPPGDQLRAGLEHLVRFVEEPPSTMPAVVQAALAHYQFETLHPYSDGNGRLGRLLIVLQLMRRGVLAHPILAVSPWLEARRQEYQDGLLAVSVTGRWNEWVAFFAAGVGAAARETHERVHALLAWQRDAARAVREAGGSGVAERVAWEIVGTPIVRPRRVAHDHGVTPQAARNALRRLVECGLVSERRVGRELVFRADGVIEILSRPL